MDDKKTISINSNSTVLELKKTIAYEEYDNIFGITKDDFIMTCYNGSDFVSFKNLDSTLIDLNIVENNLLKIYVKWDYIYKRSNCTCKHNINRKLVSPNNFDKSVDGIQYCLYCRLTKNMW